MDEPAYYLWFGVWVAMRDWDQMSCSPPPANWRLLFGPRFVEDAEMRQEYEEGEA